VNEHSSHHGNHGSRGRLRERFREATAEAILEAAERVFAEEGLGAARMERIAAEAGVAVGTLYNHFRDKHALLDALVRTRRQGLVDRMDAALLGASALPVEEQLRRFLTALFEHLAVHGRLLTALVQGGEGPARPGPGSGVLQALQERVAGLVARGAAAGVLRRGEDEVLAAAFLGMARGVFLAELGRDAGSRTAPAERAARLVDLFLRGAGP